jgi:hypothetical protein
MSLFVLTACATSDNNAVNPYAEEFAQERERATNDMQLEVLADDKITEAEVKELTELYTVCLHDAGIGASVDKFYQVSTTFDYGITRANESTISPDVVNARKDALYKKERECSRATIGGVGTLYSEIALNPTNVEYDELYAQCLVRRGIVPDDFTTEDWKYYQKRLEEEYVLPEGETSSGDGWEEVTYTEVPPTPEIYLPGGVHIWDDKVMACQSDSRPEAD